MVVIVTHGTHGTNCRVLKGGGGVQGEGVSGEP